jgi:hypothetical protein
LVELMLIISRSELDTRPLIEKAGKRLGMKETVFSISRSTGTPGGRFAPSRPTTIRAASTAMGLLP